MGFDPITAIADLIKTGIDKIFPDANIKVEQAIAIAQQIHDEMQGQIEIDKVEAASTNWFIAGWRPALGWVLVLGFTYILFARVVGLPPLDAATSNSITNVLGGMLGVNIIARTAEKIQGVART